MKLHYENKIEDEKAFHLIDILQTDNFSYLLKVFEKQSLPMRKMYWQHFVKKLYGLDVLPYSISKDEILGKHFSEYDYALWWDKYLQYFRSLKVSIFNELYPDEKLFKYAYENSRLVGNHIHGLFIRKGYNYQREIKNHLEVFFEDPNGELENLEAYKCEFRSETQIFHDLDSADWKFDRGPQKTMFGSFSYRKEVEPINAEWCQACHEAPCMCSDPF